MEIHTVAKMTFDGMVREKLLDKIENLDEVKCLSILVKLYETEYSKTRTAYKQEGCSRWNIYRNKYIQEKLLLDIGQEFTEQQIDKALYGVL